MRMTLPILIVLLVLTAASSFAVSSRDILPLEQARMPGMLWDDRPIGTSQGGIRADTVWYGQFRLVGSDYYANSYNTKAAAMWQFESGLPAAPPAPFIPGGEGWKVRDLTANVDTYWKRIDNTLNLGAGVQAPILAGNFSIWCGADQPQADALCWPCGAGYGNGWCQRITSETIPYDNSGNVAISMLYFNDTEPCFDGTQVILKRADNSELIINLWTDDCPNNPGWQNTGGFHDRMGIDSLGNITPLTFNKNLTSADIAGASYKLIIEFTADGGWSDEDCQYATLKGPCAFDNITVVGGGQNKNYTFETGLQNWTASTCTPLGDYVNVVDVGCYTILDPCSCRLQGKVLEMHADLCDDGVHPVGQHIQIESPICEFPNQDLKTVFMEFDMYAEMPRENGVLIRPGWRHYPYVCEVTNVVGWSGRVGQGAYNYFGTDPVCATWRYGGTEVASGDPVPPSAARVRAIIELLGDCDAFSITNCTGVTNFTPLFDNIVVATTAPAVRAPGISFDNGTQYQDVGSFPASLFDVRAPGPANVVRDRNMDNQSARDKCGDSLFIQGPLPGNDPNNRWEAKLWWRVAKKGAFQADKENGVNTAYKNWRDRVADGRNIDRPYKPQFTFGLMDSSQVGVVPTRNKFESYFREDDDDYVVGQELKDPNEMIADDVLRPGTRIDYFVTAAYVSTPNVFAFLPDTTGGFFYEFEILPGVRTAYVPNCGGQNFNYCAYHPATLYIDPFNRGSQFYIENSLRTVLNGYDPCTVEAGCLIPADRNWDRYDELDGSSNWNAPFARGFVAGSNNGMTLQQIVGYRAIILGAGSFSAGAMENEDFSIFTSWLGDPGCGGGNTVRQGFIANGDKMGELLENHATYGLPFLNNILGATLLCDAFNGVSQDPDCAPEETAFCLRLLPTGGAFRTLTDVDAWGSWCPSLIGYNVYSTLGSGVGNRSYQADPSGKSASFEQIVNDKSADPNSNYRSILDGVSYHHMTQRRASGNPDYCPRETGDRVAGALAEIRAALRWGFGVANDDGIPKLANVKDLATCEGTWNVGWPTDVDDDIAAGTRVNRLYQNEPNPFNPRTSLRFSLAQTGLVKVLIYDVNGRLVKTLVDGQMEAGPHSVVWDGTNDQGNRVGSGVYWSQMKAGSFLSNKKMVVLR